MKRSKPPKKSTRQKRISEGMLRYWRKRKRAELAKRKAICSAA